MTTWFTSDLHFGHKNIITHCDRPWDSVEAMNDGLVQRWNERVEPHDAVFVLGDLVWGSINSAAGWLRQLNGYKYLVPGNHDTVWEGHKNPKVSHRNQLQGMGFSVIPGEFRYTFEVGGGFTKVKLCHFPYHFDNDGRHDDPFPDAHPEDEGQWLIHGHVHTTWKVDRARRQFNVGVDVWDWYPVHEDMILKEVNG